MSLILPGNINLLELGSGGEGTLFVRQEGKSQPISSVWRKTAPGVIELGFGDSTPLPYYGELYQGLFLYIWSYDYQEGYWFVRMPEDAPPRIGANNFDHTRGELHFTSVVAQSYEGTIAGQDELTVSGYYQDGVLTMRWEERAGNQAGYAAYIIDPEWQTLTGVWWIDDYEAAPFAGSWLASRN